MQGILDKRYISLKREYCNLYSQLLFTSNDTADFDYYKQELEESCSSRDFLEYFNLSDLERWVQDIKEYIEGDSSEGDCFESNPTGYPYNQL